MHGNRFLPADQWDFANCGRTGQSRTFGSCRLFGKDNVAGYRMESGKTFPVCRYNYRIFSFESKWK